MISIPGARHFRWWLLCLSPKLPVPETTKDSKTLTSNALLSVGSPAGKEPKSGAKTDEIIPIAAHERS
jgi:hypothetical protein